MNSIPMAERRLGRSIVVLISAAVISGYRNLRRERIPGPAVEQERPAAGRADGSAHGSAHGPL